MEKRCVLYFKPYVLNDIHHLIQILNSFCRQIRDDRIYYVVLPPMQTLLQETISQVVAVMGGLDDAPITGLIRGQEYITQTIFQAFLTMKGIPCREMVLGEPEGGATNGKEPSYPEELFSRLKPRLPGILTPTERINLVPRCRELNDFDSVNDYMYGGGELTAALWAALLDAPLTIYDNNMGISSVISYYKSSHTKIPWMSYEELIELNSSLKILHPPALDFVVRHQIPLTINSINNPDHGTTITKRENLPMPIKTITNINTDNNQIQVIWENLPLGSKSLSAIFNELAVKSVNIDMISYHPVSEERFDCAFTLSRQYLTLAETILQHFQPIFPQSCFTFTEDVTKINMIGMGMMNTPGVAARVFTLFENAGIEIKMVTTSEIKISLLISSIDEEKAIRVLRDEFKV